MLRLKIDALTRIFTALGPEAGGDDFRRWRAAQGRQLERWSTYCVLAEVHGSSWWTWPDELRHPDAAAVAEAAAAVGEERLRFHAWCQWLLDRQLRAAAAESGVAVLQDLAVGFEAGGFDGWCDQDLLALNCRIGAPPDELGPEGQDWGLPPYVPWKLRAAGFEPFREAVRAVLVHAGGLRIDHVMGLFRQYWMPPGAGPHDGGYVRFPAPELLDIVAIEASRQGAFVIGEDLGTVEPEVASELRGRGILGTTLGWFEDISPEEYEPATVAAMTTHDLPTTAGVITGADAAAIHRLGRQFDDSRILARLKALAPDAVTVPDTVLDAYAALSNAPTPLVLAQLDDAVCNLARPNLPGTVDEWPNWCLPLPVGLEELTTHPIALGRRRRSLAAERGPGSLPKVGLSRRAAAGGIAARRPRRLPPPRPLPDRPPQHRRGRLRGGRAALVARERPLRPGGLGRPSAGPGRRLPARGGDGLGPDRPVPRHRGRGAGHRRRRRGRLGAGRAARRGDRGAALLRGAVARAPTSRASPPTASCWRAASRRSPWRQPRGGA